MRNRGVIIKIKNPCNQKWDKMTQNEQGKFCDYCAKTVIDFTKYNNSELVSKFSGKTEPLCGRFRKEQLNKVISTENERKLFSPSKYLAGLLLLTASKNAAASERIVSSKNSYVTSTLKNTQENIRNFASKDSLQKVIEGIVYDNENEAFPAIKIEIPELNIKLLTDIDGKFKIIIPDSIDLQYVHILATTPDFEPIAVVVDRTKNTSNIEIRLIENIDIQEIGIIIPYKKRKWWQFWRKKYYSV